MKKLFWVSTPGKEEDWFIIADNAKVASRFHEGFEGFDRGWAAAKEICEIKKDYEKREVYHAQLDMLLDMGFSILSEEPARVVMKDGRIFQEGTVIKRVMIDRSYEGEGLYIVRMIGTDKYKIGVTKNFVKRLSNLQTGNPHIIEVYYFYPTYKSRKIESFLHKKYKQKSLGGEWFEFSEEELIKVHDDILAIKGYKSKAKSYLGSHIHKVLGA